MQEFYFVSRTSPFKWNIKKCIDFLKVNHAKIYQSFVWYLKTPVMFQEVQTYLWYFHYSVQAPLHVNFLKGAEHPLQKKDPQFQISQGCKYPPRNMLDLSGNCYSIWTE